MSRPRSRSGLLSMGRHSSSGSVGKIDLNETAQDKARYKMNSKADPTKAMNEVQPSQLHLTSETTITSLRSMEHRDGEGNPITDPDRSNPTRPRLERPLDTIRAFEAAIDGSYNRRQSYRGESAGPTSSHNRRSGHFNSYQQPQRHTYDGGRHGGSHSYGNRASMSQTRHDSYNDGYGSSPHQHHQERRRFGPRNFSDPALYGRRAEQDVYPSHGHQQSYDTVGTTSNGSHMTEQWGNSTDPSSENSSIDRFQPPPPAPPKPDIGEAYGFSGFGGAPQFQGPILEEYGHGAPAYGENGYGRPQQAVNSAQYQHASEVPPSVPPHRAPAPPPKGSRSQSSNKLSRNPQAPQAVHSPPVTEKSEKRRSWLKRTFSKS